MADIKGIELASEIYGLEDEEARASADTNASAIGDLADLETTAKDNLVAAINEAAQSGGGGSGIPTVKELPEDSEAGDIIIWAGADLAPKSSGDDPIYRYGMFRGGIYSYGTAGPYRGWNPLLVPNRGEGIRFAPNISTSGSIGLNESTIKSMVNRSVFLATSSERIVIELESDNPNVFAKLAISYNSNGQFSLAKGVVGSALTVSYGSSITFSSTETASNVTMKARIVNSSQVVTY